MNTSQIHPSLLGRLRKETRALHDEAERVPYMQALVRGTLPREAYVQALAELRTVRGALEEALARHRRLPALAACLRDYHFQVGAYEEDLAWFGRVQERKSTAGTERFLSVVHELEARDPVLLLGIFYVLEGSNMGASLLRRKVQEAYSATDAGGNAALNVHGSLLHPRWKEFVGALDSLDLTSEQRDGIIDAARRTFAAITLLYAQVYPAAEL